MKTLNHLVMLAVILMLFGSRAASAYQNVVIHSVDDVVLDGPAHHGLLVKLDKIWDPNLSFYEIQLKPDSGGPFPPWAVYSTTIKPFDGEAVVVPYRNGIMAIATDRKYCLTIRAIYSSSFTPWAETCGLTLDAGTVGAGDSDGDGLSDTEEYAFGTDPNNKDSDLDGMADLDEVNNGTDPNKALYASVFLKTPSLDFGTGNYFGSYPNQHQFILIVNKGDQAAKINEIKLSSPQFKFGIYPQMLTQIPPHNELRLPVSFLPQVEGLHKATIDIKIAYEPEPLSAQLSGIGDDIPDCEISTEGLLDFGTLSAGDMNIARKELFISNASNDAGPLTFTVLTDNLGIVPGLRGLSIPPGKGLSLPVIIPHLTPDDYSGTLIIKTAACGERVFEVNAVAK